jgi:hypothetical protein
MPTQRRDPRILDELPAIPLSDIHVRNCRLVLNRRQMLEHIGAQQVVAELGVNRGAFSRVMLEVLQPSKLHLIDSWGSERYHEGLMHDIERSFASQIDANIVHIHQNMSLDASRLFRPQYFDFIYIDTDHSYSVTKNELLAYEPAMKPEGIIAGHDYSMGNWKKSYRYGVIEAVHEFCVTRHWELIFLTIDPIESQSFALRRLHS